MKLKVWGYVQIILVNYWPPKECNIEQGKLVLELKKGLKQKCLAYVKHVIYMKSRHKMELQTSGGKKKKNQGTACLSM